MKTIVFFCLSVHYSLVLAKTLEQEISSIEQRISGRVGVSVLDTRNDKQWSYRGDERFPMMSTFKTLACAKMFKDSNRGLIDKNIESAIKKEDLIVWSPITEKLVGSSITLKKACEATMLTSDNTAANIVLKHIGGPVGLTDYLRSIGDDATRLDRIEPELNEARTGDPRDTTTPNAMVNTLNKILLGDVQTEKAKSQLITWMQENTVSDKLLRSVLPQGWSIADRTGAGQNGSRGITALIWHEKRKPIIVSVYLTQTDLSFQERNRIVSEIGLSIFKEYNIQ